MKRLNYSCYDIEEKELDIGNEIYYANHKSELVKSIIIGALGDNKILIQSSNTKGFKDLNSKKVLCVDSSDEKECL